MAQSKKKTRGRGRPSNADKQLHTVTFQRDEAIAFIRESSGKANAGGDDFREACEDFLASRGYETAAQERERAAEERAERRAAIESQLNELQAELDQLG